MGGFAFELLATDGAARRARLLTPHGAVDTPAFMPVATLGTVKSLAPGDIRAAGAQMVLANTYHLFLRPGHEAVRELGGLHRFMGWDGPILTDSGGFQVWSLAKLWRLGEEGVEFRSHVDGSLRMLSPERCVEIQQALGVDIIHPLDECLAHPATAPETERSLARTQRWLARTVVAHARGDGRQALPVGLDAALRRHRELQSRSLGQRSHHLSRSNEWSRRHECAPWVERGGQEPLWAQSHGWKCGRMGGGLV